MYQPGAQHFKSISLFFTVKWSTKKHVKVMTSLLKRDFVNERAGSFYFLSDTLERASLPEQANAVKQSSSPASLICFSTRAPKPSRECSPHFPHAYISVWCRQEAGPLLLVRSGWSVPLSAAVRDVGSSPDPPSLPSVFAFERAETQCT